MDVLFVELMVFLGDATRRNRNFTFRIFSAGMKGKALIRAAPQAFQFTCASASKQMRNQRQANCGLSGGLGEVASSDCLSHRRGSATGLTGDGGLSCSEVYTAG